MKDNALSLQGYAHEFRAYGNGCSTQELAHRLGLPEALGERIESYLPSPERLKEFPYPTRDQLYIREKAIKPAVTGANFVMAHNDLDRRFYLVPTWHGLNESPITPNHAADYGSGVFEGGSMEPFVNGNELTGANIILNGPRLGRIAWSMQSRFYSSPATMEANDLAIRDLAAILAADVLVDPKGQPSRAYIRPSVRPGAGDLGLNLKPEHAIQASVYMKNWPYYFLDPERVYRGSGLTVAAMPVQRLEPILGKHASNYGGAGKVGREANNLGVDEAIYFGPFIVKGDWNSRGIDEQVNFRQPGEFNRNYSKTVLADGPGEGLIGFAADGTMVLPPMIVNQLPSTTMMHVAAFVAPELGMRVVEKPFCLDDIGSGEIVGLAYVGNAARVAPIGKIMVNDGSSKSFIGSYNLDVRLAQRVSQYFDAEVTGQIKTADPDLLTPVEAAEGYEINQALKKRVYPAYFE